MKFTFRTGAAVSERGNVSVTYELDGDKYRATAWCKGADGSIFSEHGYITEAGKDDPAEMIGLEVALRLKLRRAVQQQSRSQQGVLEVPRVAITPHAVELQAP
jgi:hypothetical protein